MGITVSHVPAGQARTHAHAHAEVGFAQCNMLVLLSNHGQVMSKSSQSVSDCRTHLVCAVPFVQVCPE